jgi:hypothetical protein
LRESRAESRFDAVRSGGLTGFVGREHELGLLMERWNLAQDGEGQVVLLSGEPGIGKSRIVSELRARSEQKGARSLRLHCSPYYVNSAFYPIIDNFERALRFAREDTTEQKLDKLDQGIGLAGKSDDAEFRDGREIDPSALGAGSRRVAGEAGSNARRPPRVEPTGRRRDRRLTPGKAA